MKVKEFDKLEKRDFENGAVLNEIRDSLKKLEQCEATNDRTAIDFQTLFDCIIETLGDTPTEGEMSDFLNELESKGFKISRADL